MTEHHCPICNCELEPNQRYPKYICGACMDLTTDKKGRKVSFGNESFAGGFEGAYNDTNGVYDSNVCYINGVECIAQEARFGGIVVQTK